jgi:hypothetical protein
VQDPLGDDVGPVDREARQLADPTEASLERPRRIGATDRGRRRDPWGSAYFPEGVGTLIVLIGHRSATRRRADTRMEVEMGRRAAALLAPLAMVLMATITPPPAVGQGQSSVHIELQGGGAPGTYDYVSMVPCQLGLHEPGDWAFEDWDTHTAPGAVVLRISPTTPERNAVTIDFGPLSSVTYIGYHVPSEATVDDRGDSVVLTLTMTGVPSPRDDGSYDYDATVKVIVDRGGPPHPNPSQIAGAWSGTITVSATLDRHETDQGSTGDPGSLYHDTWVRDDTMSTNLVDTFTIDAADPTDLTGGIHEVELAGPASNTGARSYRHVTTTHKQNTGSPWTEEQGTESTGDWTASGSTVGSLSLFGDGTYEIYVRADSDDDPRPPVHDWLTISDLSAGCEGQGYDQIYEGGSVVVWATTYLGQPDVDHIETRITGQLDVSDPGEVVEGSVGWDMADPEGLRLSVGWQLVHDGPIVLPYG